MADGGEAKRPRRVLTDPRDIRAMAHPARLAVLDALSDEQPELTATQLAEFAGISPSAMSYHLRALEKFGFVERAPASGDGRERPWRAVAEGWSVEEMPDSATTTATIAVTNVLLNRSIAEMARWYEAERGQPAEWRTTTGVVNTTRWLTAAELAELRELQQAFLTERRGRTERDHPEGARRVRIVEIVTPLHWD